MAQGRLRRLVTRRRVKWAGVGLATVFVSLAVISESGLPDEDREWRIDNDTRVYLGLGLVCIDLTASEYETTEIGRVAHALHTLFYDLREFDAPNGVTARLLPDLLPSVSHSAIHIPIAPLAILTSIATAWLWYTDRRAKPWQCAKCRYDLRGLDGGVCPECGMSRQIEP